MILDLHCHTEYSFDSRAPLDRVLRAARRRGLDALAITDHDTIDGALEARSRGVLPVIVGEEVSTDAGDIIGLFLKERVAPGPALQAIAHIRDQGGIVILPHPFSKTQGVEERVARQLHGCETFNSRYARIEEVRDGRGEERIEQFAQEYKLGRVASSDAHVPRDVGRGRTQVDASTLDEAREALREGRTVIHGRRPAPWERTLRRLTESMSIVLDPIPEAHLWPRPSDSTPTTS